MTFTYRVLLKPKDICFRKKLLPSDFDNGIPLRETLQQLLNDEILLEDIPTIDVVWCQKKWAWYTLNNRRLWVFRELEKKGKCQYIATKRAESIEHVTDFLLYGSAELIGESSSLSWDSEDGLQITVFNASNSGKKAEKQDKVSPEEIVSEKEKIEQSEGQSQREWRERTPLTIKITWDGHDHHDEKKDCAKRMLTEPATTKRIKRERKDSGFSETFGGRCQEKSRTDKDAEPRTDEDDTESEGEDPSHRNKTTRRRFSKFHRYRPYARPESSGNSSESKEKPLRKCRKRPSAIQNLLVVLRKRKVEYNRMLYTLHHGNKSRNEQYALKLKLVHTCGFCYKRFKAGVSLDQHVEELQHWSCIRCGKYFGSYTALGQHKLSLDHCNT